jgi:hypothetical protein
MKIDFPVRFLLVTLLVVGMARSVHAQFSQRGSIDGVVTAQDMLGNDRIAVEIVNFDKLVSDSLIVASRGAR